MDSGSEDSSVTSAEGIGSIDTREAPVRLQRAAIAHASILAAGTAWALGGNMDSVGVACSVWGSLAVLTIGAAIRATDRRWRALCRLAGIVWPLVALNVLVLASCFNPSYRSITADDVVLYVADPSLPPHAHWPSTARPDLSARALWFFDATYLTGLSVLVTVRRRHLLRVLLIALALNAGALAVLGTLQRLVGSAGPYFGAIPIRQPFFYATFLYHNHWGAYTLLMISTTVALTAYFARHARMRDVWHTPAPAGLVALLLLVTTLPLSGSRSCTLLASLLVLFFLFRRVPSLFAREGASVRFSVGKAAVSVAALFAAAVFVFEFARPMIETRTTATEQQWEQMRRRGEVLPRQILYRDTWRMACERLWLGWGMNSYPTVFYARNTQHDSSDGPVRLYEDAHSDWLQSMAELGVVGTACIALCGIVPWYVLRKRIRRNQITTSLLIGCGTVLGYALLEFPFGNRAVVSAFWALYFTALAYGEIEAAARRPSSDPYAPSAWTSVLA